MSDPQVYVLTKMDFPAVRARFKAAGLDTISWCNPDEFWFPHGWGEAPPLVTRVDYAYLGTDRIDGDVYQNRERELNLAIARACTSKKMPLPSTKIKFEVEELEKHLRKWNSEYIPVVQSLNPYAVYYNRPYDHFSPWLLREIQRYEPRINPRLHHMLKSAGVAAASVILLPFTAGLEERMHEMISG